MKTLSLLIALIAFTAVRCQTGNQCDILKAQGSVIGKISNGSDRGKQQPTAPLIVNATYVLHDILEVNELQRNIKLHMTFKQTWTDPRLATLHPGCPDNMTVIIPEEFASQIWTPPIRLTNAISANIVKSPMKVQTVTVDKKGQITFRVNLVASIACAPNYKSFPFDTLVCNMVVGTWLPTNLIKVNWINGRPLQIVSDRIKLASFALGKPVMEDLSNPEIGLRQVFYLRLHRYYTFYILTVYIPNSLVIMLAWSSFWFVPNGGRVGLCLSALISVSLMMNGVAKNLPRVGYVKGIDLWFLGCIILICIAFMEYAFIAFMERLAGDLDNEMPIGRKKKTEDGEKEENKKRTESALESCGEKKETKEKNTDGRSVRVFSQTLDRIFRVLFAVGFAVMAIAYFAVYVKPIQEYETESGDL